METWKQIEEFPEYAISNLGNCKKISYTKGGYGEGRFLTPHKMHDGYLMFRFNKNKKQIHRNAHRLVAKCFIPNPENKTEVNHLNLNKADNRAENLEWCTPKENMRHARTNRKWKAPTFFDKKTGLRIESRTKYRIPNFYQGMTATKEGKKEYMKHYWKFHERVR